MRNLMAVPALALVMFAIAACGNATANYTAAKTSNAKEVSNVQPGKQESGDEIKEYKFSNDGSKLSFLGEKVTAAHPGGFKKFTGKVLADSTSVKAVEVEVDMTTLWAHDTGDAADKINEKLTGHLKSPDFFDVEKYKTAKFITTGIKEGGQGGTHTITANLTMLDKTKSIEFPATIKVEAGKVTAQAKFKINRTDWGIVYKGMADDLIKNDVGIEFDITAK